MTEGMARPDRIGRLINQAAGLSVVALCGTLVWAISTGNLCSVAPATVAAANAAGAGAPPPRPRLAPPAEPVALDGAATIGAPTALVTLLEYSDFGCPFCARFATETLPALEAEYVAAGRLRLAYKHYPIPQLHPDAPKAAEAAECAAGQGRFRQMHDALFAEPRRIDEASLVERARTIGLDEGAFARCLADGETRDTVQRHAAEAERFGITGTPAFFVGVTQADGRVEVIEVISGAQPAAAFRAAIERALATAAAR
jgi:protein-disulfide isomerase